MPYQGKKIAVVMPAYNAAKTLLACYQAIPKDWVDDVILVDDASFDNTVAVASTLPLFTVRHERNRGYGGNQSKDDEATENLHGDSPPNSEPAARRFARGYSGVRTV